MNQNLRPWYRRNIPSIFSSNSEAFASELLENIEEMFPQYYMQIDMLSMFKSFNTHRCVTRRERGKRNHFIEKSKLLILLYLMLFLIFSRGYFS